MVKKQALGKGLGALLSEMDMDIASHPLDEERVRELPIFSLQPNAAQPRKAFPEEKLAELAESIKQHGIMQPLIVTPNGEDYTIVAGERRWRAAKLAGLSTVPCLVRQLEKTHQAELSLLENIQREDLTPLEEAAAYAALLENFGYTQEKLAHRLGKSRPLITNTLRLLQLLPQEREALSQGKISPGHARALLSVKEEKARGRLLALISQEHLSVRQAEEMAAKLNEALLPKAAPSPEAKLEKRERLLIKEIEKQLTAGLGLPAKLKGNREKGRLIVEYRSGDDLQNILDRITGMEKD